MKGVIRRHGWVYVVRRNNTTAYVAVGLVLFLLTWMLISSEMACGNRQLDQSVEYKTNTQGSMNNQLVGEDLSKPIKTPDLGGTKNGISNHVNNDVNITNEDISVMRLPPACSCKIHSDKKLYNLLLDAIELENSFSKSRLVRDISCSSLFENNKNAISDILMFMRNVKRKSISNSDYYQMLRDCKQFRMERGYPRSSFTETERDFPLAFSIIFYSGVEQMERLLRSIYRPHNVYCIHIDSKTKDDDKTIVRTLASCFPNVFVASKSVDVQWGKYTLLEADLICMKELWAYPNWRYFINLTGQEFPLKTNLELVQILRAMQWANVVDGTWIRARAYYLSRWLKSPRLPPHNIRPIKGSLHVAINRDFVDFALHDNRSKDFLVWLKGTKISDESFFSSLNHNTHLAIPGSFLGDPEEYPQKPSFMRYVNWEPGQGVWTRSCSGKFVRKVCVLGIGDLHRLKDDISLFVNKFHLDFQHYAFDCIEELMYNRTRDQYLNRENVDVSFYSKLDQVRRRYIKP